MCPTVPDTCKAYHQTIFDDTAPVILPGQCLLCIAYRRCSIKHKGLLSPREALRCTGQVSENGQKRTFGWNMKPIETDPFDLGLAAHQNLLYVGFSDRKYL